MNIRHLGAVLLLVAAGGCARNPVTHQADYVLMSQAEEIELGRRYHQQMLARYHVYNDAAIQGYVNGLGQSMAILSHRSDLDYHFTVIDSPKINAFALPGGYIYVTRGILAYLDSEAELAGVLGHEIGHVAARHAVRADATARTEDFFGDLLFDHLGHEIDTAYVRFAANLAQGYGREYELEADALAVEYLARSGYAPTVMDDVIALIKGQAHMARNAAADNSLEVPVYHGLSSHPDTQTRRQLVDRVTAKIADELPPPRDPRRDDYRRRLQGLVFGPSGEQGRLLGRHYLHGPSGTGLLAPVGWRIDSDDQVLQLTAPARDATIHIIRELRPSATAPRTILEQLPLDQPLADEEALLSDTMRGWMASSSGQTAFGIKPLRLATWLTGDYAWIVIASARQAGSYVDEFEACIRSFHSLDDAERALAEPWRIDLVPVAAGTTYAGLAADSPLDENAEAVLRLLNGQAAAGAEPVVGDLIKIVR